MKRGSTLRMFRCQRPPVEGLEVRRVGEHKATSSFGRIGERSGRRTVAATPPERVDLPSRTGYPIEGLENVCVTFDGDVCCLGGEGIMRNKFL